MNSATLKWKTLLMTSILSTMQMPAHAEVIDHHWFVGMDAGMMQVISRGTMTVPNGSNYPPPNNVDQYSTNHLQPGMMDIQVGQRWERDKLWLPSYVLAVRYEHVFERNISGNVIQYSDSDFTNYSYSWDVSADVFSLYSKLDLARYRNFMFYIDLGAGISLLQSHSYSETALPNIEARISPDYPSKTNYQFSYNVGAGLDYILSKNVLLSAGYSYQSFGNLSSCFGKNTWGNARLNYGKLNANMGFVGVSYLF